MRPFIVHFQFSMPRFNRGKLFGDESMGAVTVLSLGFVTFILFPMHNAILFGQFLKRGAIDLDEIIKERAVEYRLERRKQKARIRSQSDKWNKDFIEMARRDRNDAVKNLSDCQKENRELRTTIQTLTNIGADK